MAKHKTIVFLGDGMADESVESLGGMTPLQHARTPHMDRIASSGRCGTLRTLPEPYPTSSDVANMSVLGCDLATEITGRGVLEALSQGITLEPDDVVLRLNLVNHENGVLLDYSAGQLEQAHGKALIEALSANFGTERIRFHTGLNYRHILVLSGAPYSKNVATDKPDDNHGETFADHMPRGLDEESAATVEILHRLILESPALLEAHPINHELKQAGRPMANGVWPYSIGTAGSVRTLQQRYGIRSAVISGVDVINGLGVALGMDVLRVEGATGYIDTNYEGKADAAVAALPDHDFIYIHVEGIDEVSHEMNAEKKVNAIEAFDARLVGRVLDAVDEEVAVAVLPDHPVPVRIGKHTRDPVPVAVRQPGVSPDAVATYDETTCPGGALGAMQADDFANLLLE